MEKDADTSAPFPVQDNQFRHDNTVLERTSNWVQSWVKLITAISADGGATEHAMHIHVFILLRSEAVTQCSKSHMESILQGFDMLGIFWDKAAGAN